MSVSLSLDGRHALVCGASRGIGRAAATALGALGARLTLLARNAGDLQTAARELSDQGVDAAAAVADLDDRAALPGVIAGILRDRGDVHVLINNTGGPAAGPLLEAPPEQLAAAFARHVLSAQVLVQHVLPGMRQAGYGRIINVLSTSVKEPIPNLGVSNTIRGAMASWSKTLSGELPPGVTINNVLPGFTDTERLGSLMAATAARTGTTADAVREAWRGTVPEGRIADPSELGAVIAFLASPAASYVRGVSLPVDGGRLRSL